MSKPLATHAPLVLAKLKNYDEATFGGKFGSFQRSAKRAVFLGGE
jgi:hypothetical protein